MTGREKCLKAALEKTTQIKDLVYGKPEDNFKAIASMWEAYLWCKCRAYINLKASDVAHMMALLKIVRATKETETEDSYIDACGYMACAYEAVFNPERKGSNAI